MLLFRLAFFLAIRQIRRSTLWSTLLIILVMTLTFLNLVVVSGLLVGLPVGAVNVLRERYTSDVLISTLREKTYIDQSSTIIATIDTLPEVVASTARYVEGGTIEANYKTRTRMTDLPESVSTLVVGINPADESAVTGLDTLLVEGSYLEPTDFDQVVLGSLLLDQYLPIDTPGLLTLRGVTVGSKVKLSINGIEREVTVKGIVASKADEVDRRVFMVDTQVRALLGRTDFNVDEIAIKLTGPEYATSTKRALLANGFGSYAKVQTYEDAQPKFLDDIKKTFALLGAIISSIGLAVAAITIFIVIFINAITRRKYIGIMKAIGIDARAIEMSYVFQSLFYAVVGSSVGLLIVYGGLVPYFNAFPIQFPFSDGILVATLSGTAIRVALLVLTTAIAGYIPARIIVNKNTLDSVLGRK
jgi:putative ABC transport system permease protein